MTVTAMTKDFGELKEIEFFVECDFEHVMTEEAYKVAAGLPPTPIRFIKFPEQLVVTVKYATYYQKWSTFNVKKEDFDEVIKLWESTEIEVGKNDIWIKTIKGYTFQIMEYGHKLYVK